MATQTCDGPSTVKAGRELTAKILRDHPDLDCIYYSNDDLAVGGLFHCIANGVSVPETLVLAGFNGLDIVESLPIKIATSRTPRREIGRAASEIILDSLREGAATRGRRTEFSSKIDLGF